MEIGSEEYINEIIGDFQNILCDCIGGCQQPGITTQESVLAVEEIDGKKYQISIRVTTDENEFLD